MTDSEADEEKHTTKSEVNWQCFFQNLSRVLKEWEDHAETDKNFAEVIICTLDIVYHFQNALHH